MDQGYFLAIAGNIGVGKTELTNRLSAELGWAAYYEPVIQNPYLDLFYRDMPRWSFHLQIYFLSERFKAQVEIGRSPLPFIQDRTIYEDAEIFARTLHDQGSMTRVDYENYVALFQVMVGYLRRPDLILYLRASPETLMERIARRGRASEKAIGLDYIRRLNDAYDGWMQRARADLEVLELDTDRVPLQGDTPAFRALVGDLKRRYPRQAELRLEG
ncbi:MAG TPA: deoxynucleoside kinase [Candidatus Eisenbacteria bacterium]|nr:deoxynucleoside kinase [Candidatus Eisenbacteria bacterium]